MIWPLLRPLLFRLDAETAHRLAIRGLAFAPRRAPRVPDGPLAVRVAGLNFANPLGLAAGFDKDGKVPDTMLGLGFGHVEVGTITPLPQPGNPRPRLFRLAEDRAVINRMGFNNGGAAAALERLGARLAARRGKGAGVLGVNIGANKASANRIDDYIAGLAAFRGVANYITVNISSPNTPGLRDLQGERELDELLGALAAVREAADPPVFLKVAPDIDAAAPGRIVEAAVRHGIAAIIVANTTLSRPPLRSAYAGEAGGLSGAPLKPLALACLRGFHAVSQGTIPLIGVGGIATAEDAWERIRAGASLVQLYSAMVYEGPGLARAIVQGLEARLAREGMATIGEVVGSG